MLVLSFEALHSFSLVIRFPQFTEMLRTVLQAAPFLPSYIHCRRLLLRLNAFLQQLMMNNIRGACLDVFFLFHCLV